MEFTPFEKYIIEALDDCSGQLKHCARNAILHLEKAWKIRKKDMEMSMFRGITAEEEAASAFFYCLKNHKYKNASKLQFKQHTYKLGLFPFLQAVGSFLGDFLEQETSPFYKFSVKQINLSGRKAIELLLFVKNQELVAHPIPPLHFTVSDQETNQVCTFEHNFKELIEGKNYSDTLKYIKDIANLRNKLLYASSSGRPEVEGNIEGYLNHQKKQVMVILILLLMIDPWEKEEGQSLFVQQGLDSFLLLLQRISAEDVFQPKMQGC